MARKTVKAKKKASKKPAKSARKAASGKSTSHGSAEPARKGARKPAAKAASKPTLHGSPYSGPTYKVALMLALLGEPFDFTPVDLRAGAHKTPEFLAINRYGQIPAMTDGDLSLCQSGAILQYLAAKHGKFGG